MEKQNKYKTIGQFIKDKREELNMTQEFLANIIGVTAATVSLYESGDRSPDLEKLDKIANALSVPLAVLLDIEMPEVDLDIALRSEELDQKQISEVRRYIRLLKYERMAKAKNK